ncbi:hypothetical protein KP001_00265 [Geomonas subterranea]|uniref:Uncharacterized protein n=1 Tax=Geomonas subterranea TaxID=2847989 RepID=A0ABX8LH14_9BACT|nr:hypothetical protein [Geomonas subterranea]QXE91018.1 hypothetical protein KP001_00265 [Geomonas subterranea]QXM10897.1 hypothetical protein KP002_07215 [Geomonas subterranea]
MKIYLYCPKTGVYQGEDFADAALVFGSSPDFPTGATTIAPPSYGTGEVPVFLAAEERWVLSSQGALFWKAQQPVSLPPTKTAVEITTRRTP